MIGETMITPAMLSAVVKTARSVMPDAVVTVAHQYTDAGGSVKTQTFPAIRGGFTAQQRAAMGGTLRDEDFRLIVTTSDLDLVWPGPEDKLTVQEGDAATVTHVVRSREIDPTRTVLTLTVGPQYG